VLKGLERAPQHRQPNRGLMIHTGARRTAKELRMGRSTLYRRYLLTADRRYQHRHCRCQELVALLQLFHPLLDRHPAASVLGFAYSIREVPVASKQMAGVSKLPDLKARGAIASYIVTEKMIHINLTGPQKRRWFKKGP
jgi:hypothetical protein